MVTMSMYDISNAPGPVLRGGYSAKHAAWGLLILGKKEEWGLTRSWVVGLVVLASPPVGS